MIANNLGQDPADERPTDHAEAVGDAEAAESGGARLFAGEICDKGLCAEHRLHQDVGELAGKENRHIPRASQEYVVETGRQLGHLQGNLCAFGVAEPSDEGVANELHLQGLYSAAWQGGVQGLFLSVLSISWYQSISRFLSISLPPSPFALCVCK